MCVSIKPRGEFFSSVDKYLRSIVAIFVSILHNINVRCSDQDESLPTEVAMRVNIKPRYVIMRFVASSYLHTTIAPYLAMDPYLKTRCLLQGYYLLPVVAMCVGIEIRLSVKWSVLQDNSHATINICISIMPSRYQVPPIISAPLLTL